MRYAHIVGWGKSVPEKIVTNDDLARTVNTSDEWIRTMTGIRQRHIASDKETTASLSTAAAIDALDMAGVPAAQLDLIIVSTVTPDYMFPSTAALVQDALGADNAGAYDLSAACAGFLYALSQAADSIRAGTIHTALVIGAERLSSIVDWKDRNTCVLFGDGAGAVVLKASTQPGGVLTTLLRADGSGGPALYKRQNAAETLQMNGREVFRFATRVMDKSVREVMRRAGWTNDQVDVVVPHQANIRIIDTAAKALGIPMEKFFVNIDRYGNTSAASIPIALCEAVTAGKLKPDDKLVLVGFGGGLTWAAAAVQWLVPPKPVKRSQRVLSRLGYGAAAIRSRARRVLRRLEDG
ncbi:MAG: ketoacyl-ACP synthase III [Thermoflexales bacterium]|nr:ketoacyl-ACP synthase III [Thermoflexales bacterium]